jgi:L-alanine-DL-glutamate epimerase-like enolase superfamily enzyme
MTVLLVMEKVPRENTLREKAWEDSFRLLRSTSVHRFLSFLRPQSFEQAVEAIAEMPWEYPPDDKRRRVGNAARCALELALLDAYGRYFGKLYLL